MDVHIPELILSNARVLTLDSSKPRAEVVAIRDGRILFVGPRAELERLRGPDTRVYDCGGGALLPGFHDAHLHMLALAARQVSIDCSPRTVRSILQLQGALAQAAQRTSPGRWVRAWGYNEFYLQEQRHPTRWDLDEAVADRPVLLAHRSGHALVLNSLALRLVGITRETPGPPEGVIERDEGGEPTGLLLEMGEGLEGRIPPLSRQEMEEGMRRAGLLLLSRGVTAVQDATPANDLGRWETLRAFKSVGLLPFRCTFMVGINVLGQVLAAGLEPGAEVEGLRVGPAKVLLTLTTGALTPPLEELREVVLLAHLAGFQVAFHTVEAEAVEAALDAIAYAQAQSRRPDPRHRLEHCSECSPALVERLRTSGATVVTNPTFVYHSGERYRREVEPARRPWLYRIGSLHRAGVPVAFGSDAPVEEPDPLLGVYAAATRRDAAGEALGPEDAVRVEEALRMATWGGAYATFQEGSLGTIAPGKAADLVVLDQDPTAVEPAALKEMRVLATVVGGKVLWER